MITLRRFGGPFPATRELEQFPADYPLHTRRSTIVFDLRGNGGGSLQYTEGWIARGLGGALRRQPLLDFAPCGCCEWNRAVEAQVRAGMVDTPGARQERADALTAIQMEWAHRSPVARLALRIPAAERPGSAPYSGRVFALIDRGTGSSGELTALELRRNLNAMVIGERSGGGMQYGQLGTFVLPGTGLVCRIPTRRFFHDGAVEGVGVPVDLYLQDIGMDVDAVVRTVMKSEAVGQAIPV